MSPPAMEEFVDPRSEKHPARLQSPAPPASPPFPPPRPSPDPPPPAGAARGGAAAAGHGERAERGQREDGDDLERSGHEVLPIGLVHNGRRPTLSPCRPTRWRTS